MCLMHDSRYCSVLIVLVCLATVVIITIKLGISKNCLNPGLYPGLGLYAGPGFCRNMSKSFIFATDAL